MSIQTTIRPKNAFADSKNPKGLHAMCNAYMDWCRVHNYSHHTIDHAYRYLKPFTVWAKNHGYHQPDKITRVILERYQNWLFRRRKANGEVLSFSTQKCYLVPLRSWFRWLAKNNHIPFNPASELELPKQTKKLPKGILTAQEVELIMRQPDATSTLGIRDRAILETFYSTGMRRMELAGLGLYDIDRERGTIHIHQGKGKKERVVPVGDRALYWLDRYQSESRPKLLARGKSTKVLFLTHHGDEFTLYRLSQLVQEYIAAADIGKKGSCHLLRHTMATLMVESGCDIRYLQVILGHASLKTTEIYTQVSIRKLVEVHRATHPANLVGAKKRNRQ